MSQLKKLLSPKSIAVFGGGWSQRVLHNLVKTGYDGELWPVHPSKTEVLGLKCFADVDSLPFAPDASFIGVNRKATHGIIKDLAARKAGGAVLFAAGYSESGEEGEQMQNEMIQASGDMAILGPNCYGFINYMDDVQMWPDTHGGDKLQKGVALITQSSNIGINMSMYKHGLDIAMIIAAGNQAKTSIADLIFCLCEDPRITAIGIYMEGLKDVDRVAAAFRFAHKHGKRIILIKTGRSEQSINLTHSHTASIAGADAAFEALINHCGVARVHTLTELMESLKVADKKIALEQAQLVTMSCSGGEAGLIADLGKDIGVSFPSFTPDHKTAIAEHTHPLVHIDNPFDYHTFDWGQLDRLSAIFDAVCAQATCPVALIIDIPHYKAGGEETYKVAIEAFSRAVVKNQTTGLLITTLIQGITEEHIAELKEKELTPLIGMHEALTAIRAATVCKSPKTKFKRSFIVTSEQQQKATFISEWESKAILRKIGIETPNSVLCRNLEEARQAVNHWQRSVCKAQSLTHKTEHQAVALDVNADSCTPILERLFLLSDEVLVEEYLPGGVEVLIGIAYDELVGLYLTIASGGTLTELLSDRAVLTLMADEDQILAALKKLKLWKLLSGWRGAKPANIEKLIEAILKLSRWAQEEDSRLLEADLNPLSVFSDRVVALDALFRIAPPILENQIDTNTRSDAPSF